VCRWGRGIEAALSLTHRFIPHSSTRLQNTSTPGGLDSRKARSSHCLPAVTAADAAERRDRRGREQQRGGQRRGQ
jgi:hypothetical protein